jgi:thiol-disulfide isomerase/thioredoxin
MRARLPLLISFGLAAVAVSACAAGPRGGAATAARAPAGAAELPSVEVAGLDGRATALGAALGHRPTLVSFWAPWCEPCVRELPELERLSRAVAPCGAAVVGVAVGERPQVIADFARARRLTYPQFTDEPFRLADALGQRRIPATVVFDGAARVVFTGDALDARATAALARALVAATPTAPCPALEP